MTTTRTAVHPFANARRMRPTKAHRPAIWECMLATVYARNAAGETRYFDYDWDAARAFAGADLEGADPRVARAQQATQDGPRRGQLALYIRR